MQIMKDIRNDFKYTPDLVIREIKNGRKYIYIIYLETISSGEKVNNYILKNIANYSNKKDVKNAFAGPNIKEINYEDIENYICNGFTIIVDNNKLFAFETRADLDRSISTPDTESGLYSPKDSLVENMQKNIGLIKKRIKSKHLKTIDIKIGKYTKTSVNLLYIDNIAKPDLINNCLDKLKEIDVDGILASGDLKQFIIENNNVFPSVKLTERPDFITKSLLEGKIAIIVDTSPFAIIIPAFLTDYINPFTDNYSVGLNVNFLKILRMGCFILTLILPAFYIALTCFNPESIPNGLMLNIAYQRLSVPFPSIIEAIIMLLICEILRESDLRFPSSYGSAISILGALVLGDSAVSAGIASPIMIIVIALTFISSLMFNDVAMNSAIRAWRYIFLLFAVLWGMYGIVICALFMLVNLCSYNSFGFPYLFPLAPFDKSYFKETIFKSNIKRQNKRTKSLSNNIRRLK